ncbi:MAG: class I SAM-dependent methyltransferase [Thermoleophilia bacterium]|nr:class I SAM-dependent methyltransferase [Thermoleophilia bacterium]
MPAPTEQQPGAIPDAAALARWPEAERRRPGRSDRHYLALGSLADALEAGIEQALGGRSGLRVLDVGCGNKPYLPLLADRAASYIGVDAVDGPQVDKIGVAEDLPFEDAAFDVVLCTQVLEHVDEPATALAEIRRVLAPGGVTFVSTHGVFLYHPDPPGSDRDYWRWTHSGLMRIFRQTGEWSELRIQEQGNVVACLGYIVAQYVDEFGQRLGIDLVRRAMLRVLNSTSKWLDARFPPRARVPGGGSLSANYLVTAVKPGTPPA